MSLYADSEYPVAPHIEALHEEELESLTRCGTWWSARERAALAAEARRARCETGAQESCGDETTADSVELPEPARRVVRAAARGGIEIDRAFCEQARADGLGEEAYVETVGLAARLAHLDVFARGIGVPSRALPAPVDRTEPACERPPVATAEGFYTASVPSAPAGGELAESIFGPGPAPNILRSLSLVPEEARRLNKVMDTEYFSLETIFDLDYSSLPAVSRRQIEIVAAKVSALNQCFY